jgi:N-acetyl-alpha-D-glucosaminyl L-malate synthase BshA
MKPKKLMERPLSVGITCYPSVGGSGIVASQLGAELAQAGHKVHFISYEPPFRLDRNQPNVQFHQVQLNEYNLFKYPDYTLPLAVKMVEVASKYRLDVLHVHYAVPHATAALLATQIAREQRRHTPHIVTTLHGTDITLLGRDPNLMPIIKYSIESSCAVTAVSESLRQETIQVLKTRKPIHTIYNFYRPKAPTRTRAEVRKELCVAENDFLLIHLSNLRPVKRVEDVLKVLANLNDLPRVRLLLLAGGPFEEYRDFAASLMLGDRLVIRENVLDIENYLDAADAGLYASERESFGMGVLETMSFGKPVVATKVGGVAEIVEHGKTGFLNRLGDIESMTKAVRRLANDPALAHKMGERARAHAAVDFSVEAAVRKYVDLYRATIRDCRE